MLSSVLVSIDIIFSSICNTEIASIHSKSFIKQNLQLNILLSKLKEISAGIDYEFPYERTALDTYLTKIGFQ